MSPGAWLDNLDWDSLAPDQARVVLAHGSIQGFSAIDYDTETRAGTNQLQTIPLGQRAYDYLA